MKNKLFRIGINHLKNHKKQQNFAEYTYPTQARSYLRWIYMFPEFEPPDISFHFISRYLRY